MVHECIDCGKELKQVTHYHHGYQGQGYTATSPEKHERPGACIRYLVERVKSLEKSHGS